MKYFYPDIYYRLGRIGNPYEYDWMEDETDYLEKLKHDLLEKREFFKLIEFIIEVIKTDTLSPLFLKSLGEYDKISESNFISITTHNSLIKSFKASSYSKATNQLKDITLEFSNPTLIDKKTFHLSEKNTLDLVVDDDVSLKIRFIKNTEEEFTGLEVRYVIDYLEDKQ